MNKTRRKTISKSIDSLKSAHEKLQATLEAEKAALRIIPANEDNDEKLEAIRTLIDNLEDGISNLGDAIDTLEGADF